MITAFISARKRRKKIKRNRRSSLCRSTVSFDIREEEDGMFILFLKPLFCTDTVSFDIREGEDGLFILFFSSSNLFVSLFTTFRTKRCSLLGIPQ